MEATERTKTIDSYVMSERKMMIRENDIRKETGTVWFLIETKSLKISGAEKERQKGNVGNFPLSRISNNSDINSVA